MTCRSRFRLYGADDPANHQRIAFTTGATPVAVYGLGKMGLPLAAVYAETTGEVIGVDLDEQIVRTIGRGECPHDHEPELPDLIGDLVDENALRATTDGEAAAREATIHVLIVPTLLDGERPDLSALEAATETVAAGLSPGDVVFVECTVPPGTCRDVVAPILREQSDVREGAFGVAACPERTSSGRALTDIRGSYPKVVGGIDDESGRVAELVYGELVDNEIVRVGDAATAEAVKVLEGIYRDVNIALANELATVRDDLGIDVTEAIDAANTLPYSDIHTPGAGVGGHCIPYYPYFLTSQVETDTPLVRTARAVNDRMPAFTARKVADGLDAAGVPIEEATVAVLGVTYRAGVPETRDTPAVPLVEKLERWGAEVLVVDPLVDPAEIDVGGRAVDLEDLPGESPDAAVLVTAHDAFVDLDWAAFDPMVVVDGRQALSLEDTHHRVYTIGGG